MDFRQSDDRRMLMDSLGRWMADGYGWEHRARVAYDPPFHDPAKWAELCELGALLALAPEEAGGFGGAGFDVAALFEALGRGACPEPVLPALLAARLLMAADAPLDSLLSGEAHHAAATGEPEAPYALNEIAAEARGGPDGWRVSGRKSVVYGGQVAARFLVAARTPAPEGGAPGEGRLALLSVEAADARVEGYGLIDGGGAAELLLEDAPARMLLEDAGAALEEALDWGRLALCAEAVGLMDATFEATLDYMRTRKQFGRPIGAFQALQHRMVDLRVEIEQARSITVLAASAMEAGAAERGRRAAMAKSLVGRTARLVAEEAIQLHGGIAMTWEFPVSHFAKRLVMLDAQLGDSDFHLARLAAA
jgi:alkylation response protein AidB-like acyl-CoA dehydrogenase